MEKKKRGDRSLLQRCPLILLRGDVDEAVALLDTARRPSLKKEMDVARR
jgi:hypothetical protein